MQTVRRLYVYALSAISLAALVTGLTLLLGVLFDRLGLRSGVLFGGEESIRQQLTVASALTAVSLPLWLIHWTLAERSVRPGRPGADLERTSAIRGLYIGLAMGALLFATGRSLGDLVQLAVERILGATTGGAIISGSLALALVAGAAWGYHLWIRTRDWRHAPMRDAGAWLPRHTSMSPPSSGSRCSSAASTDSSSWSAAYCSTSRRSARRLAPSGGSRRSPRPWRARSSAVPRGLGTGSTAKP